eukprot:4919896-Prymnesium_polylepis.1
MNCGRVPIIGDLSTGGSTDRLGEEDLELPMPTTDHRTEPDRTIKDNGQKRSDTDGCVCGLMSALRA